MLWRNKNRCLYDHTCELPIDLVVRARKLVEEFSKVVNHLRGPMDIGIPLWTFLLCQTKVNKDIRICFLFISGLK